ncbi:Acetyltransf_1 domain-containing protein [Cephalotus follicularis]|uniref:Acetyltransf_1 domain-containing protein n=1 Tax=Cephalotus follicularis TaxID=3775 RepID=A0A1Q3DFT7_CEPFO|nr:Acetyltransf_1 domain-containing protein [Cephalotus follicularis]
MAAATLSLPFFLDPQNHETQHFFNLWNPINTHKHRPIFSRYKYERYNLEPSHSSLFSSSSSTSTTRSSSHSYLEGPYRPGHFLSNEELEKLKTLEEFTYNHDFPYGSLFIRVMRPQEVDVTVKLLSESFAESMLLPMGYESFLRFLVKQYLIERRCVIPHAVTLLGFYRGKGEIKEEDEELAGTVEICFDKRGAIASPPTPTPPKNSPYICNMTVKKELRRKGIGWNLLKASEELITQISYSTDVYLHCRMIDSAPFNMYTKAGYHIVKTDSLLILLMLQRRKHLMCKKLPVLNNASESNSSGSTKELYS